jgi:hypothetical protein
VSATAASLAGAVPLVVRWYRTRPLWIDEEMIALNLRDRTLGELPGLLWLNQAATLGWLALQRAILVQFGTGERSLRALPVLFGIATVLLAAWAGRRWMGPMGATIFVLLCSFGKFISHYPLEVKQYSADAFCGLLVPVLTWWALEPKPEPKNAEQAPRPARLCLWWLAVIVVPWISIAALLVAPGCALILCAVAWQRGGWRKAAGTAAPGLLVIACFALQYQLSLRASLQSEALRGYWWWGYPPASAGFGETLRWLAERLKPLADNPGGSRLWVTFWVTAAAGMLLAWRENRRFGLTLLVAPVSAFVLAAFHVVPLAERLSLWMLPSLYAAIAIASNRAIELVWRLRAQKQWMPAAAAGALAVATIWVSVDIVMLGVYELSIQPTSNHGLDDRSAMRSLMAMHQPGDAFVSNHMTLPAVWWYGGVNVAAPNLGRFERGGIPVLEAALRTGGDCVAGKLPTDFVSRRRVLVYLGFDSRNPSGMQELVLDTLSRYGRLFAYRHVAEEGLAAAFDLTQAPGPWMNVEARLGGQAIDQVRRPGGCIDFFPATRW